MYASIDMYVLIGITLYQLDDSPVCNYYTLYVYTCRLIGNKMSDDGAKAILSGMNTMVNLQKLR